MRIETNDELGFLGEILNRTIAHFSEMEIAAAVQGMLLPNDALTAGGFQIWGRNVMTQAIGGDYYDYFRLGDGRVVAILGDVSGHGFSAALVTAMAKAAFTILCPRHPDDPAAVLGRINDHLCEILKRAKMMTCALVVLDPATGTATLCNTGQTYPLLVDTHGRSAFQQLVSSPMGISPMVKTACQSVVLGENCLVYYSDGLVEAECPAGGVVGYERFALLVGETAPRTADDPCGEVLRAVRRVTDPVPWADDATVLIIRRQPEESHGSATRTPRSPATCP